MKTFIFDVDGTLALPNQPIESQFMRWFEHWMLKKEVFLCTNNTYENILPRLGRRIVENCKAVFTCGGNSIWINNKEAVMSNWRPSYELTSFLESLLKQSEYKTRSGPNIEYRVGMISFSLVGKMATEEDINRYKQWDKLTREKKKFIESIKKSFPNLSVCYGSDTSIDICEKGKDKSQILQYFNTSKNVNVILNSVMQHGNDKTLYEGMSLNKNKVYNVHVCYTPEETQNYLRSL